MNIRRIFFLLFSIAILSLALNSCSSQNASNLVRTACTYVNESISTYNQSASTQAQKAQNINKARIELRKALPLASIAAGEDPQYQALQATLSESSRVPEGDLIHALKLQCAGY